jgi:hypothetical protein
MRESPERPAAAIVRKTLGSTVQRDDIAVLAIVFDSRERRARSTTEKMNS